MLVEGNSIEKIKLFFINEIKQKTNNNNFKTCSEITCKKKQNRLCVQLMCATHCRNTNVHCKQHKKK